MPSSVWSYVGSAADRAERAARTFLERFFGSRLGFWVEIVVSLVLGGSIVGVIAWTCVSWLPFLIAGAVLLVLVLQIGAYLAWRDLYVALHKKSGIEFRGGAHGVVTRVIPETNMVRVWTSKRNEDAHNVVLSEESRTPIAVKFELPRSRDFVRQGHLPARIMARKGIRRYPIIVHRFVPGGVVFDDREAPYDIELILTLHFADGAPS